MDWWAFSPLRALGPGGHAIPLHGRALVPDGHYSPTAVSPCGAEGGIYFVVLGRGSISWGIFFFCIFYSIKVFFLIQILNLKI